MASLIPYEHIDALPLRLQVVHVQQQLQQVEREIAAFHFALNKREKDERLTDLISEVYALRKELGGEVEEDVVPFHLSKAERKRLKFSYHKAAWLCHPDNLAASQLAVGQQWFERLQDANQRRDVLEVERILLALQTGEAFGKGVFTSSQLFLHKALEQQQLARLLKEVEELRATHESPEKLLDEDELNFYVYERKIALEEELAELRWHVDGKN